MNSSIILLEEVPDNFMPLLDTHKNPKFFSLTFHAHQSLEKKKIFHEHGDKFLSTKDKTKINDLAISATINTTSFTFNAAKRFDERNINDSNIIFVSL